MKKIYQITYFLCFISILYSCKKETEIKYVTKTVTERPSAATEVMFFSENPLVFVKGETNQKKVVITSSDTVLEYSVISVPNWVLNYNQNGFIYGLHDFIVTIDTFKTFPYGVSIDSIEFYTIYGKSSLEIQFINGVGEQIVVTDTIDIGELTNKTDFSFFNRTQDSIPYSLNSSSELTLDPTSGVLQSFKSQKINVTINRSKITQDTVYFYIDINFNNEKKTVVVRVLSFFENKLHLQGNVIDAAYDHKRKKLYYINNNPNQLVEFDPATKKSNILNLSNTPIYISLSSSGNYAAIANDGNATLVNLNSFSVINTFTTGARPYDIILKDSAFVYIFPEVGGHVKVQCIDLQNNYNILKSNGRSIYEKCKAALHPTQDAIYTADNGVNPADVTKVDVSNDTATVLYDSPYHGDYDLGGDLWITKNGNRLITRGKTVLQTTTTKSTDMIYSGSIQLNIPKRLRDGDPISYFGIRSLDEDSKNDKIVIAAYNTRGSIAINQVYLHKTSTLQYLQSVNLENFVVPNTASGQYDYYNAEPFFTFFTGYGDEILVLTKGTGSGLSNPWGLELINP